VSPLEEDGVADLLPAEAREWLLDELRALIAARGARTFLVAPILEPTARDFPDPFHADEQGVRVLLRRILAYAGLEQLHVEVETFSQPDELRELDERGNAKAWGHEGTAAWFAGVEDGHCHFGVAAERIGEPETLVGTLCHEVAHAWRAVHGLVADDRDLEEQLTDLSTVYLGFGLLTTNASYRYRQSGELTGGDGTIAVTRWSHARGGYLPPEAMSFLFAAQVKARDLRWFARRRLIGQLETNQAAYFRWALGRLGTAEALRNALGLSATATTG
jgi:hypothetical protein